MHMDFRSRSGRRLSQRPDLERKCNVYPAFRGPESHQVVSGILAQIGTGLVGFWLKSPSGWWDSGSNRYMVGGILARIATWLVGFWLKSLHGHVGICARNKDKNKKDK